jgi:hypothetical protein
MRVRRRPRGVVSLDFALPTRSRVDRRRPVRRSDRGWFYGDRVLPQRRHLSARGTRLRALAWASLAARRLGSHRQISLGNCLPNYS